MKFNTPSEYISCALVWIEYVAMHFSVRNTHIYIHTYIHTYTYRIAGNIGEKKIWRFAS